MAKSLFDTLKKPELIWIPSIIVAGMLLIGVLPNTYTAVTGYRDVVTGYRIVVSYPELWQYLQLTPSSVISDEYQLPPVFSSVARKIPITDKVPITEKVQWLDPGYYQLLRWSVMASAAVIAFRNYKQKRYWAVWLFGFIAILFNPLAPISFEKATWQVIDVLCSVVFLGSVFIL